MPPEEFQNNDKERMYQIPHKGKGHNKDNQTMYLKLKEYLIDMMDTHGSKTMTGPNMAKQHFKHG